MQKILIIGATSAIAEAAARLWAPRGAAFYLVGRNAERLVSIADDLKAFRKRGGRIEVLGNTPLRSANNASPFRSSPELRKPPTPVTRARKA